MLDMIVCIVILALCLSFHFGMAATATGCNSRCCCRWSLILLSLSSYIAQKNDRKL